MEELFGGGEKKARPENAHTFFLDHNVEIAFCPSPTGIFLS